MINTITHLRMFDVVVNHAFTAQKPKGKGEIILQEDYAKFENARRYGLYLNRLGLIPEMYNKIARGNV